MMQSELLEALLGILGEGTEDAAAAYQNLHQRLVRFFRLNNGSDPESLADEAMDRLARNAADRSSGSIASPLAFALGIARHILQEDTRRQIRQTETERDWSRFVADAHSGDDSMLHAIEACLARMPENKQELLRTYYAWSGKRKIDHHRQTADRLGLTINALRNRLMRARNELDICVRGRLRDVLLKKDITNRDN